MTKKLVSLCICLVFIANLSAQVGKDIDLQKTILTAKNKANAKSEKLELSVKQTFSKGSPFLSLSLRLEGRNISAQPLHITLEVGGQTYPLQRSHEFDRNERNIWVSDLLFLETDFEQAKIFIEGKNIAKSLKKGKLRIFNPQNQSAPSVPNVPQNQPKNTCGIPPSVSRSVWGSSFNLRDDVQYRSTPSFTTVTHLIVHHSASANTSANWGATVLSFFDYHVNTNGWSDIGYNYLIAPDGTLFVGRGGGNNVVGAHFCGKNGATMGICMIGTYMTVAPTDTAMTTLERLLAWKCVESNINPTGIATHSAGNIHQINGHRIGCATDCPGDSTFARLPTLRGRVATRVAACRATSTRDFAEIGQISIFPNPVIDKRVTIQANLKNIQPIEIQLFDVMGRQVFQKIISENSTVWSQSLDLTALSKGIYFCYINVGDYFTTQKIVIP
jgi:hypothetical protein